MYIESVAPYTNVTTLPNGLQFASARTGQSPVQAVPACPLQIRAHHHIHVYTYINKVMISPPFPRLL